MPAGCKQAPAFAPRTPQHPSSSPVLLPAPTSLPMSSLLLLVSSSPHPSRFSLHSSISGVERVRSSLRIYGRILRRGEAWLPESILRLAPGREWLHAPPPPGISFTRSPSIRPAAPPICPSSPPNVLTTLTLHGAPVADVDTLSGHKLTTVLFSPNWNLSNRIPATNWCFSTSLTLRSVFARKRNSVDTNGRIGKTSLSKPSKNDITAAPRQCDPVVSFGQPHIFGSPTGCTTVPNFITFPGTLRVTNKRLFENRDELDEFVPTAGENDVLMGNLIRGPQQHGIWVGEEGERSRFPLPTHCDTRVNMANVPLRTSLDWTRVKSRYTYFSS